HGGDRVRLGMDSGAARAGRHARPGAFAAGHHGAAWAALQGAARRAPALARCAAGCDLYRAAVRAWQVPDRLLPDARGAGLGLWRGRLAGAGAAVGVLLVADPVLRHGTD